MTRPTYGSYSQPEPAELEAVTSRTENDAVAELALKAALPYALQRGEIFVIHDGRGGVTTIDLTGDQYRDTPRRIAQTVHHTHTDSLLNYWSKYADGDSEMWADPKARTLTAIIDAHAGGGFTGTAALPDWQQHRATLQLHLSDPLTAWIANNDKPLSQEGFGEFLEDQMPYIGSPAGADLMEMVHQLEITQHAEFKSGVKLKSGARVMHFLETIDGKTRDGQVEIPDHLTLRLPIWRGDTEAHEVTARFRYRANVPRQGQVALLYKLNWLRELLDGAFETTISGLEAEIGRPVFRGTPA
jgi:hypothetical protein